MTSRFLVALLATSIFASISFAQRPGGTGGGSLGNSPNLPSPGADVQVRVVWPDERSVPEVLHVQLINASSIPVMEAYSDRDGKVTFRSVPNGTYSLKIQGDSIEDTSTESFLLTRQDQMHNEIVYVKPKQSTEAQSSVGHGPMISASELNVPEKAKKMFDKAMEAYAKGDMKKAEELLNKSVEVYPRYARAWNNIGVIRIHEKDQAGALAAFQKAVEADGKFAPALVNLARLSKDSGEFDSYIGKALSSDPDNPDALALLARKELLGGKYSEALASARKAHNSEREHSPEVHLIAGQALLRENRKADAVQEYEIYLKEDPNSPEVSKVRAAMAQIQAQQQKLN